MEDLMSVIQYQNLISVFVGALLVTAACSTPSGASKGNTKVSKVHTVSVGPKIEPLQINAGPGDEVRWVNSRSQPIAVIFPESDAGRISCRSGFKSIGSVLSAVVPPNGSASMCFAKLGKYDYQVRLDENLPSAETDRNASVFVVGGGERNPRTAEAFENVTP
jgi:plastocyanin